MVDKNLFLYNLAVVAIFKNEAPYFKEWLDYHLLAGVEHFYLYNNDSSDNYKEVLAPYVEKNLVTLTEWSGKLMMYPAYNDAIDKYRFDCRYMAFIDLDEFIFPKTNQNIVEVVDEILSGVPNAAGLGINWQCFGSNGQDKADYSKGVLERFTRRAPSDWHFILSEDSMIGNTTIKSIVNPRLVDCWWSPHYAFYFRDFYSVNSNRAKTLYITGYPVAVDKIVINHYYTKSKEEYERKKIPKGSCCMNSAPYAIEDFHRYNHNEIFDDGILKYRSAREEKFSLESDDQKISRVKNFLIETLTQASPFNAPEEFFIGKLETFLTCRAIAEKFQIKIGDRLAEEYALVWIYQSLIKDGVLTYADLQLFVDVLPKILARPYSLVKGIRQIFSARALPTMIDATKNFQLWRDYKNLQNLKRLLETEMIR